METSPLERSSDKPMKMALRTGNEALSGANVPASADLDHSIVRLAVASRCLERQGDSEHQTEGRRLHRVPHLDRRTKHGRRAAGMAIPCNFGGSRPWFACPHCWARVAVLYLRWAGFCCRPFARVAYYAQSEDPLDRSWRVQQKAEGKLGKNWTRRRACTRRLVSGC